MPPQPPPGPRKGRIALWTSLSILLAGIATFLVVGLVLPGFLLDERPDTAVAESGGRFTSPKELAVALVNGLNQRDRVALHSLTCADASEGLDEDIEHVDALSDVTLTLVRKTSPRTAVARLSLTLDGDRTQVLSDFRKTGRTWCWQDWKPAKDLTTI